MKSLFSNVFFRGKIIDVAGILLLCFAFGGSALVGRIVGYAAGKAWFGIWGLLFFIFWEFLFFGGA
jgi:hypothetical protein